MAVSSTRAKLYAVRKNVFIALLKHGYFDMQSGFIVENLEIIDL